MSSLSLRELSGTDQDLQDVQSVFDRTPGFMMRTSGRLPLPTDAEDTFAALPPGLGRSTKHVFGVYLGDEIIGCVDLVRGFPNPRTAMLGLLILAQKSQAQGHGRVAYQKIEEFAMGWPEIETMRLAVLGTNQIVVPFWRKLKFIDTGIRKPYEDGPVKSEQMVFEKRIR